MKGIKKIISVIIILALTVSTIPFQVFDDFNTVYAAEGTGLPVKYDDFTDTTGICLTRDAAAGAGVLTVSPSQADFACGVAYTSEKIKLKDENSFSTYFEFNFDNTYNPWGSKGADGMTFSLQPVSNNALGASSNMFGIKDISPSLSIEFDTYQNSDKALSDIEPYSNHIAVFKNGDPYGQNICTKTPPSSLNFSDPNKTYHVWIDYDGLTDSLKVNMGTTNVIENATEVLSTNVDIYSILGTDEVFAGFSAGSGAIRQDHNVYKWYMSNDYSPINLTSTYFETTQLSSTPSIVSTTETEITYILKDHLNQPISGQTVYFETTEGSLSDLQGTTDGNGQVSVSLQSASAINASVKARTDTGRINTTTVSIEGQPPMTDQESVDVDAAGISLADLLNDNVDENNIISDLSLPSAGVNGTTIAWASSDTNTISNTGTVARSTYTDGDKAVNLTATVSKGTAVPKTTAPFSFIVKALPMNDQESVDADIAVITIDGLLGDNVDKDNISGDLSLPSAGANGTTIIWASSDTDTISNTGTVTRPSYSVGDKTVTLTATVSKGPAVPKTTAPFSFIVKALPISDQESVDADFSAITIDSLLGANVDKNNIETNLTLPVLGANGSAISWESSDTDIISDTGVVTRPSYAVGDKTVILTATVSKGTAVPKTTAPFSFIVKAKDMTASEKVLADFNWLKGQLILNGNESTDFIKQNLNFPTAGPNGSSITWTSSNSSFIETNGNVTRPSFAEGNQLVSVTSTNTLDGVSRTKHYVFNVLKEVPTDADSVSLDAESLDYSSFIAGNVSPFSIQNNLSLPSSGVNGTTITWVSSDTSCITNAGTVNRPSYEQDFKAVQLTATVSKGASSVDKVFPLAVKPLDDTTPPSIMSSTPSNGETVYNNNNITITITFSENIVISDSDKITLKVTDENGTVKNAAFDQQINDNILTIVPCYDMTDKDTINLSIANDAVSDPSGNTLQSNFAKTFTSVITRPEFVSQSVADYQTKVPMNQTIEIVFQDEIFIAQDEIELKTVDCGDDYNKWYGADAITDITIQKDTNKLIITPQEELKPNTMYCLNIADTAITNDIGNSMKKPIELRFSTESISEVNLVSPMQVADVFIYDDYIKMDFDQLIEAEYNKPEPEYTWYNYYNTSNQDDVKDSYFTFGKSLFIKKDILELYGNGYDISDLRVTSTYNPGTAVAFSTNDIIEVVEKRVKVSRAASKTIKNIYLSASESNEGSCPTTPASFGQRVESAINLTLDYRQTITAQNLNLISVENIYGTSVPVTAQVSGSKLIITPLSGKWNEDKSYILKVPEGTITTSYGTAIKKFEYPFKTPVKYDYSDTSISVAYPKLAVGSKNYIYCYVRNNRPKNPYSWYSWNAPENYTVSCSVTNTTTGVLEYESSTHNVAVECDTPGIYQVVFDVTDKSGYTYQFTEEFEVVDIEESLSVLTSRKKGVEKVIDYTEFEDHYFTDVYLTNGDMPLGNRRVKLELIGNKSGRVYYTETRITAGNGHADGFDIPVDTLPYGKLKAVFSSPDAKEDYTYYIVPERIHGSSDINIFLYDQKTKKLIRNDEEISVYIDDDYHSMKASKKANGTYILEDIRPGTHDIKIETSYYCEKSLTKKLKDGNNKVVYYLDRYVPSSSISVSSTTSDYVSGYSSKDAIFIDGVDANITFNTPVNWNNHQPGQIIYEFYNKDKTKQYPTTDGKLTVNVGNLLGPGTRCRVFATSKDGTKSSKRDIKIEVASKPLLCYASYSKSKKKYFLNYNFSLEKVGSAQVPSDWPLIGGEQFKFNLGNFPLGGVMDQYGKIDFAIGLSKPKFENATVKSNYKKLVKDYRAGELGGGDIEFEFAFDTNQSWQYDVGKDSWSYKHGDYIVYLKGELSYTQYFMLAVVPTYLKAVFIADGNGKLNVDVVIDKEKNEENLKYSGELNFAPTIEIIVGAGVTGLSVEGFLSGGLETCFTIPSCDFSANGKFGGGVRATALLWDWEKKVEYTWVIAKKDQAVLYPQYQPIFASANPDFVYVPMMNFSLGEGGEGIAQEDLKQTDFNMISRDSSNSDVWVGNQPMLMVLGAPAKITDSTILEDVPDFTKTGLTAVGNNLLLVWPEDNPNRTSTNRTELKYAVHNGSEWSEGSFFNMDNTADFNPVVAATTGGAIVAWEDSKRLMQEGESLEAYLSQVELSAAQYKNGVIEGKVTLTDDDYYDCMPAMACSNGTIYMAWVKNKSNNILSPAAGSFEILYAENSTGSWSQPTVLETGLNQVTGLDIAVNGSEVTVVYGVDTDGNILTGQDQEIYQKQALNNTWQLSVQLTNDAVQDGNVKVMYKNNQAAAVWIRNGILSQMTIGSGIISPIHDILAQAFEKVRCENGMQALTYTTGIQDGLQKINTIFFDEARGEWSNPVEIAENNRVNGQIAAAITNNNEMTVIHKSQEKIIEEIGGVKSSNVGTANVESHKMTLTKDLKVVDGTINFTDIFMTGEDCEINATVENCGEFTINGFDVEFTDGQNISIGTASVNTPLLPGQQMSVSVVWLVPETVTSADITVTVDPSDEIGDVDRTNNTITGAVVKSDVSIESINTYPVENNNNLLEMELANYSPVDAQDVKINFYHNETLVNTQTVPIINYGSTEQVVMEVGTAALFGTSDTIETRIDVNVEGNFADSNDMNDTMTLQFDKQTLQVVSSNVDDGALKVSTDTDIILDFSDNISEGADYNNIKIADFDGNAVPVTKEISYSKLIIKPVDNLSKGTYYLLTVPKDSIATANGQKLINDYRMSFTTDTSDISITGTYPANNAEGISITDNITVQFNKNIIDAYAFEQIALIKNGTNAVTAAATINGDKLIINPSDSLSYNTVYTVFIPRGAVIDEADELTESNYEFSFITIDGTTPESTHSSNDEETDDVEQVDSEQTVFVVELSDEDTMFSITDELLKQIKDENKTLIINRKDIALTIPSQLVTGTGQFDVSIETKPISNELTHEKDKLLSNIYEISAIRDEENIDIFDGQISVSIPVDIEKINNPEKCAAFYQDEDGDWHPVGGVIDIAAQTMQVSLSTNRPFVVVQRDITFEDTQNRWSAEAVEVLASKGIINGKSKQQFAPTGDITRAEFTALIARSIFEENGEYKNEFSDIDSNCWYASDIAKAAALGLVSGVGNGQFAPDELITREDMIVVLNRLYQLKAMNSDEDIVQNLQSSITQGMTFTDFQSASDYSREAIIKMAELEIVNGYNGNIMPKDFATREQAAAMIYRLLKKMERIVKL